MKKLVALALAMLLICGSAFAEIDWASMTDDEIKAAIEAAQAELDARKPADAEEGPIKIEDGLVLLDTNGVKVTVAGEPRLSSDFIDFDVIVENNSDKDIYISNMDCSVNGWAAMGLGVAVLDAGLKTRTEVSIAVDDAQLSSLSDVEEFYMELELLDYSNMDTIYKTGSLQYTFK